jgi:hypothetical protein
MRLHQKRFFTTRTLEIKQDGFKYVQTRIFNQKLEIEMPFEDLRITRIFKQSKIPFFSIALSGLFGFYFFVLLISQMFFTETELGWSGITVLGIITAFWVFMSFNFWINEVYIITEPIDLVLFRNKKNKKEVDAFLKIFYAKAKDYVREKYLNQLENSSIFENIEWLYGTGYISKSEFEQLKKNWRQQRTEV